MTVGILDVKIDFRDQFHDRLFSLTGESHLSPLIDY